MNCLIAFQSRHDSGGILLNTAVKHSALFRQDDRKELSGFVANLKLVK